MSTFGFDYFVKRQEVLSEMARLPMTLLAIGPAGKRMAEYKSIINGVMRRGGTYEDDNGESVEVPGLPSGKGSPIQNRTDRYIIYVISGLSEDFDSVSDSNERAEGDFSTGDELTKKAIAIYGYPGYKRAQIPGKPGSQDIYRLAIEKWTKDNQEEVLSEEFKTKLTSESNILKFLTPFRRKASHSPYGELKTAEKEQIFGMDTEDYHRIISNIAPYLKKIHQLRGYNKIRKTPLRAMDTPEITGTTEEIDNIATDNVALVIKAIKQLITLTLVIRGQTQHLIKSEDINYSRILNPANFNTLDEEEKKILLSLTTKVNEINNTGFRGHYSKPELLAILKLIATDNGDLLPDMLEFYEDSPTGLTLSEIGKELQFERQNLVDKDFTPIIDRIGTYLLKFTKEEGAVDYPEYSYDVLDRILTTPESKKYFHAWYVKIYLPAKIAGYEKSLEKRKEKNAASNKREAATEFQRQTGGQHYNDKDPNIDYGNDEGYDPNADNEDDDQFKESYVMNYMSEQISKDRFTPNGEYKERGFKKPMNYAHWLMIND